MVAVARGRAVVEEVGVSPDPRVQLDLEEVHDLCRSLGVGIPIRVGEQEQFSAAIADLCEHYHIRVVKSGGNLRILSAIGEAIAEGYEQGGAGIRRANSIASAMSDIVASYSIHSPSETLAFSVMLKERCERVLTQPEVYCGDLKDTIFLAAKAGYSELLLKLLDAYNGGCEGIDVYVDTVIKVCGISKENSQLCEAILEEELARAKTLVGYWGHEVDTAFKFCFCAAEIGQGDFARSVARNELHAAPEKYAYIAGALMANGERQASDEMRRFVSSFPMDSFLYPQAQKAITVAVDPVREGSEKSKAISTALELISRIERSDLALTLYCRLLNGVKDPDLCEKLAPILSDRNIRAGVRVIEALELTSIFRDSAPTRLFAFASLFPQFSHIAHWMKSGIEAAKESEWQAKFSAALLETGFEGFERAWRQLYDLHKSKNGDQANYPFRTSNRAVEYWGQLLGGINTPERAQGALRLVVSLPIPEIDEANIWNDAITFAERNAKKLGTKGIHQIVDALTSEQKSTESAIGQNAHLVGRLLSLCREPGFGLEVLARLGVNSNKDLPSGMTLEHFVQIYRLVLAEEVGKQYGIRAEARTKERLRPFVSEKDFDWIRSKANSSEPI
ncbi:MAG: hypothetical protein K1X79_13490 [Oligoflexia bacterium]|nr:hypothetical protein [Oligoflexia bacterium]